MYILICEFRPIQSVNKAQCPIHFWSSEVQLQNKSDFRLLSMHVLLHELVPVQPRRWSICSRERQSLSVHSCGVHICQAEREQSGGPWVEWREYRLVQGHVSRHQKLLLLLSRSPAEHCGGHPVYYIQLYVDMLSIGWEGCVCGITQFIVVAVVVADAVALWQMHTVVWENCVCPFFIFIWHLGTHTVLGGLSPFL